MSEERPILFNSEMVRAILDGRKVQTRRVVKPSAGEQSRWLTMQSLHGFVESGEMIKGGWQMWHPKGGPKSPYGWIQCPYGQVGEQLWVRETFQPLYKEFGTQGNWKTGEGYAVKYPATDPIEEYLDTMNDRITSACKPSIHMPRWASRITLEITDVRVERLQDISEEDAKAEGAAYTAIYDPADESHDDYLTGYFPPKSHSAGFEIIWREVYGLESWNANPWTWVITFKRI